MESIETGNSNRCFINNNGFPRMYFQPIRFSLLLVLLGTVTVLWAANEPAFADTLKMETIDHESGKQFSRQDLIRDFLLTGFAVDNPVNSKLIVYQGVLLTDLLNVTFGNQWQRYELIKFTSSDGYQPLLPVNLVQQHRGLIAFKEVGRTGLSAIARKNGELIDPGPFFLVWENIMDQAAKKQDWLSWPWQLATITLTDYQHEFPHAVPTGSADKQVQQGFILAMQHCIKCHTVNGEGGKIGPELNDPLNVTEYWQPETLKKFILEPRTVRPGSNMIAFYRDVQNREALVDQIIVYLNYMAGHKLTAQQH